MKFKRKIPIDIEAINEEVVEKVTPKKYKIPRPIKIPLTIEDMKKQHSDNKNAVVGAWIICPTCGRIFKKRTYNQIFCSNGRTKKHGNCKDDYWNETDDKRKARKTLYNIEKI